MYKVQDYWHTIFTNITIVVFHRIEGTLHYKMIYCFLYYSVRKNIYYKCKMPLIWRCTLMSEMLKCEMSWNWWNTILLCAKQRREKPFGRMKCLNTLTVLFFQFYFSLALHYFFRYVVPDPQLLVTLFWEYLLCLGLKVNWGTNSSEEKQSGLEGRQKCMTVRVWQGKKLKGVWMLYFP